MITFQKRESTVLQLHDNTIQDGQHGRNVQKEQHDGLAEEAGEEEGGQKTVWT